MQLADKFETPLFTPATKEDSSGHDINVSEAYMAEAMGE